MDEVGKIALDEFEKKADGSWVCVKNADINTKAGRVIRVSPGVMFKKGYPLWGVDVAEALDQFSA